jgi:hypothetical protein
MIGSGFALRACGWGIFEGGRRYVKHEAMLV